MSESGVVAAQCGRVPPRYGVPASRRVRLLVSLLAIFGALAVLFWFNPARYGFYPTCFFHRSTGLLCPGCGLLRSTHQLLHGNIVAAIHFNALFVLSLPVWALLGLKLTVAKMKQPVNIVIPPKLLWAGLGVLVLFGILRNLPFAHSAWLAP